MTPIKIRNMMHDQSLDMRIQKQSILDTSLIDDILWIDDEDAFRETVAFARSTGILVGISSGANIALAKRLSQYYP